MSTEEATARAHAHAQEAERLLAEIKKPDVIATSKAAQATAHATMALYYQRAG